MALVWQYQDEQNHNCYEIRSAGSSLRLYTNGAFHSQYSSRHLFTGGVWDLLSIPSLFDKPRGNCHILMLGVGGGTAIHQLNRLLAPRQITGIEIDAVHLKIATDWFGLNSANIKLIEADATSWIRRSRAKFDVVVDDLFIDAPHDPVRPVKLDEHWMNLLHRKLRPGGILIQNHLDEKSARLAVRHAVRLAAGVTGNLFSSALLFTVPHYENSVLAMYKNTVTARAGRHQVIRKIEKIDPKSIQKLRFNVRQVY